MKVKTINVADILANFYQPRTKFDREKIKELSESILTNGLINPITITPDKKRKGKYMIVSGERRWQAHRVAGLKTIQAVVKEYKDETSFMIESLVENLQREDLSSMETAKFIKKIWIAMGKPDYGNLATRLGYKDRHSISEYLNLVEDKTPKEVKKAVEEGKLAMRSASMIRQLPKEEQVVIAKESMKRETGMGRSEVRERVREERPEKIKLERTANDIVAEIADILHDFKYKADELLNGKRKGQINIEDIRKSLADNAMTTSILHLKIFKQFVNALRQRGAKPDKYILELIKAVNDRT